MVSAFYNTCPPLPTIGHVFLELLRYYGYVFQNTQMIIAEGEYIVIHADTQILPNELFVLDLFQSNTNAAANVTKFGEIREVFMKTYEEILKGNLKEIELWDRKSVV